LGESAASLPSGYPLHHPQAFRASHFMPCGWFRYYPSRKLAQAMYGFKIQKSGLKKTILAKKV
jgi:hypothetical protein